MELVAHSVGKTLVNPVKRIGFVPVAIVIAAIGFIACQYHSTYVLAAFVVVAWGVVTTRKQAYLSIVVYSLFSTWVVVPAIIDYLGWHPVKAMGVWLAMLLICTSPWLLLHSRSCRFVECRLAIILAITWIPPVGLVQFASPFVGTSLFVSGFGWYSIAAGVLATGLIIRCCHASRYRAASLIFAVLLAISVVDEAQKITGWIEVNTEVKVGGLAHTIEGSLDALQQVRTAARANKPRVAVLGESTGGYSVKAGESFLRRVTKNTVVLAGGRVDEKQALFMWGDDDSRIVYNQRVRPILLEHMDGDISGRKVVHVDGLKIAPLICYEGSVPYPIASAMFDSPEAIVTLANFHWSRNAEYFERVLRSHIAAWGRIFSIPTIVAVNRRGTSNV